MPLLDCVADMQVIYRLDMDDNGLAGTFANADGSSVSSDENDNGSVSNVQATMKDAALLRDRLKEVRVYILAHEGQSDSFFTFNNFTPDAAVVLKNIVSGSERRSAVFILAETLTFQRSPTT